MLDVALEQEDSGSPSFRARSITTVVLNQTEIEAWEVMEAAKTRPITRVREHIDMSGTRLAGLSLLLLLLACQAALLTRHVSAIPPGAIWGDERDYVGKAAYLQANGRFPRIPGDQYGSPFPASFWGNSDWRPFGYPALLAAITYPDAGAPDVRTRVAVVQFVLTSASVLFLFVLVVPPGGAAAWAMTVAVILGASPWPFAFAGQIGPETTVLFLSTVGTGVLGLWAAKPAATGSRLLLLGSSLLSLALLFRPESIVLAPILVMVASLLRAHGTGRKARAVVCWVGLAAIPIATVVAAQVAYRAQVAGRIEIFGPARFFNEGAFAWLHTWLNTEKQAYDGFAYRLGSAEASVGGLPPRAFRDDSERLAISSALASLERTGRYTKELDAVFAETAAKRRTEAPLTSYALPRLSRTVQLWINTETSPQLLSALALGPRPLSRATVGGFLLAKLLVLTAFGGAVVVLFRSRSAGGLVGSRAVIAMFAAFVLGRTLLIGVGLGWMVARYMIPAWPALLVCGCEGLRTLLGGRSHVPSGG